MEMQVLTPTNRQAKHFNKFIQSLILRFQPLQLFCISESITSEENKGCFKTAEANQRCDYCLLMVTENVTRIDHDVQHFANIHYRMGNITFICHAKKVVQNAISQNSRFFIRAYQSAKLLYSHDGHHPFDSSVQFIPTDTASNAKEHFNYCISLADGFLRGAVECLANQRFTACMFMLHQAVEQCCITLIKVHIGYRSEVHNLQRLLGLCRTFSERPYKLFMTGSDEDKRLFDLLVKSYCDARYSRSFSVTEADAIKLQERISAFVELTQEMCETHIRRLAKQDDDHQHLQNSLIKPGLSMSVTTTSNDSNPILTN
ncbi:HEPN domain-containing protein [Pedobacter westerhofensis]|uniref:HEPN domain-containing protein n=1 Tax=Pedobacter westerhofensis TaxID=425512 RepID=A0A521F8U7_9SPHI|nr:HEPN domain-containing protein [Pedobacter westerhofensis]SMO92041.1 HEPN domain-containing protein [Pedobacter westerhofensis]